MSIITYATDLQISTVYIGEDIYEGHNYHKIPDPPISVLFVRLLVFLLYFILIRHMKLYLLNYPFNISIANFHALAHMVVLVELSWPHKIKLYVGNCTHFVRRN